MTVAIRTKEPLVFYNILSQPKLLIHEEEKAYVKHDQLFKELIGNFFEDFIAVFFPEFHTEIDFTTIKPLSE